MRDLSRTTHLLINLGRQSLLERLLAGPLSETVELQFSSGKVAKQTQDLLYQFLWFYPDVKARLSMRLVKETATLLILPKSRSERRGRKGGKKA